VNPKPKDARHEQNRDVRDCRCDDGLWSCQPTETVDELVANPHASRKSSANARKIARRSAMNFACAQPQPPNGASSVTAGAEESPVAHARRTGVALLRQLAHCYLDTPQRLAPAAFLLSSPQQELWLFKP
jgi:hypothetical protein